MRAIDGDKLVFDVEQTYSRLKTCFGLAMEKWSLEQGKECLWAIMETLPDIKQQVLLGKYDLPDFSQSKEIVVQR